MSTPKTLRDGRFVILGMLGEGSQGRTFDAVDAREGRPVAIKRFDVRGAAAWKDVELAEREARVLQSLSHPSLPRYVDHFEEDGALYLVMEKIEGETLAQVRKRGAAFGEEEIIRFLGEAANMLGYLHGRAPPVIHRDLKPANVIRRPDGSFAFVDFGAVRDKLRPEGGSTVVGTFGFMAPEQFQGRALPGSDVYAIGATAVSMMSGQEPEELPHKGLTLDVRAALAGRGSERMVGILERMLEPDPDRRAHSIAPLLQQRGVRSSDRSQWRSGPQHPEPWNAWRQTFEQDMERWAARFEHQPLAAMGELPRAMRHVRRQARRAQRDAWRRTRGQRVVPWPFSFVLAILFTLSIVAVSVATQVVVPLVLLVLSIVFGRSLRNAADSVRSAGQGAIAGIHQSRQWLRTAGGATAAPKPDEDPARVRVDGQSEGHARIADEDRETAREDDEERQEGRRR